MLVCRVFDCIRGGRFHGFVSPFTVGAPPGVVKHRPGLRPAWRAGAARYCRLVTVTIPEPVMLAAVEVSTGTGVRRARKLAGWACAPASTAAEIPAAPRAETTVSKTGRIAWLFYAGERAR